MCIALVFCGGVCQLPAEWRVGELGAVTLSLEATAKSSSNVFLDEDEVSDFIFSSTPKVQFRASEGYASIDAFLGLELQRYAELTEYDAENIRSGLSIRLPDEPNGEIFQGSLDLGYNGSTAADADLQAVVEKHIFNTDFAGRYMVSEYFNIRSGLSYRDSQSEDAIYADVTTWSAPLALYYQVDEALSVGAGYRWRHTDSRSSLESTETLDHAFYFGVEDLISPLVQYELQVGFQFRDVLEGDGLKDDSGVYLQSSLHWFITDRTQFDVELGNEFGNTMGNQLSEILYTDLSLTHQLDARLRATVGVAYQNTDYDEMSGSRTDTEYRAYWGATYTLIENRLILSGQLSWTSRDSTQSSATYDLLEAALRCEYIY
ncbi:outer membrane beta-barrel protein [Coraliomargarita sp. SDUM461004]|uniref:Outer membrane beta-barrel protein n=1 Tax=Thalassobacterium sedimentorum TaxID=3041258 RepID=A0ABU1AMB2_9BACT|nr:outer membrane beta-barrel protein [Coraliomargarita sp. SDUM461004]MDQ8195945.1 outer membrane beta-barrel protein [Coraliomargarita sp. SDUM461004]